MVLVKQNQSRFIFNKERLFSVYFNIGQYTSFVLFKNNIFTKI